MSDDRSLNVRREARVSFIDPEYQPPTPDEIRSVLSAAELTGAVAGQLLGVTGRTVRKWTGDERDMPYSAWRLLLFLTGLAITDESEQRFSIAPSEETVAVQGVAHERLFDPANWPESDGTTAPCDCGAEAKNNGFLGEYHCEACGADFTD